MKKKFLLISAGSLIAFIAILTISCSKNDSESNTENEKVSNTQGVSLYLTDGPADYEHVYIDIQSVEVMTDTCSGSEFDYWDKDYRDSCISWNELKITPGAYDLLTLNNGVDAALAQGTVPKGKIKLIKFQLGSNNTLVKSGATYALKLLTDSSAVYLNLRGDEWDQSDSDSSKLWIDFDVARSVFELPNNKYYLSPVLTAFVEKNTGNIEGEVLPDDAYPYISVYNNSGDTTYNIPRPDGYFKVRALETGTYSLKIDANNGYKDTVISNISITSGKTIKLSSITLHK